VGHTNFSRLYLGSESISANIMYHINGGGGYGLRRTKEEESGTRSKHAGERGVVVMDFPLEREDKIILTAMYCDSTYL
jgi:hypothetical protein